MILRRQTLNTPSSAGCGTRFNARRKSCVPRPFLYKILYKRHPVIAEKEIRWVGSAHDDLMAFPAAARRQAGFQLGKVQAGLEPDDWKPFADAGPGTHEIRLHATVGAFRVMYVAKFEEAVYVLHCFQKKTQATSRQDRRIAAIRYRAIVLARKSKP
ncbi:MAG: type II toxin-antitoxin system RelE/ParE family toxin [Steroidobacteraceae bacterium]